MFATRTLSALLLGAALLAAPFAFAADATTPPTPAALAAADQLLATMGVKQTIATVVPSMLAELEANITKTRPDIRDSLRETLKTIQPEFDKTAKETYEKAEALLTLQMTDKELEDVATFFASPVGKKFLATEPVFFQQLQGLLDPWRQQLSTDIVTRAREEMKKKGIEF